jgi:hypothetical protein
MFSLKHDQLIFRFPDVHADATCAISFERTLRLPDDDRAYPLPPGLGHFPLAHVADFSDQLPDKWRKNGGVFLPMAQAEAMWISFHSTYPFAIKIAAGRVNAVSGGSWATGLHGRGSAGGQDYVVTPEQPWLDGFNVGEGVVRQFIAMPLGAGYTAEAQITEEEVHGGLQFIVMPLKAEHYRQSEKQSTHGEVMYSAATGASYDMGLAAGGLMRQKIYDDPFGVTKWDQKHGECCFVYLLNSTQYEAVTARVPPCKPPTADDYARAGLPWFALYDEAKPAVPASDPLRTLDSVAALGVKKGETPLPENGPLTNAPLIHVLDTQGTGKV